MRDPGLLVGEFESAFLQEVSHERLDLITKEFLRYASDQEGDSSLNTTGRFASDKPFCS
jgi:hypothetical protein